MNKNIYIISGGTNFYIRPHMALSAPAFGETGKILESILWKFNTKLNIIHYRTKMAGGTWLDTNKDVHKLILGLNKHSNTKIVFMPVALVDYNATLDGESGKNLPRVKTKDRPELTLDLVVADKIIQDIRKHRKDIFVVGFKTTTGLTEDQQYLEGLNLLKSSSINLVLANDIFTRTNMIITPEEARYHVTKDRFEALSNLVDMALLRSHLTFTRSSVVSGEKVSWDSELIPDSLRTVVNHCVKRGAYKPFRGATVGHFAVQLASNRFLTSIRKSNFNDIDKNGLVLIETDGPDSVIAYGAKPSVGGQSQRIIFNQNPGMDCIVHFHCPKKLGSLVPVVSQREFECGSHECGRNTANGLRKFGNLLAVYLDNHGPNIVFNSQINPQEVIDFIETNFDLLDKTGGYVSLPN